MSLANGSRKPRAAVVAVMATLLAACGTTDTDFSKVPPTARIEVFGTKKSTVAIDLTASGELHPPAPPVTRFDPDDIVVRVTGSELNRGLGKATLLVRLGDADKP